MIPTDNDSIVMNWVSCRLQEISSLPGPQYKQEFTSMVQDLLDTKRDAIPSTAVRLTVAEVMPEAYFNKMGEYPGEWELSGLAEYICLDYYKSVNKSKNDPLVFHSAKQLERRMAREYMIDTNDTLFNFLYAKYILQLDSLSRKNLEEVDG